MNQIVITFKYLTQNLIESIDRFDKAHENAFLGVAISSIVEFLGRCLRKPEDNRNGEQNFYYFIDEFLSKEDIRYKKYATLLYKDLRHGSAHSVLSKEGVILSFDRNAESLHLRVVKFKGFDRYALYIYSPRLIHDLKSTIYKFVENARRDKNLTLNYYNTFQSIIQEGQELAKTLLNSEDKNQAIEIDAQGDIVL